MITTVALSPAIDKIYFLDQFTAGKLYRAENVVTSAGGKGINVARVASLLGEKVRTTGFIAGNAGEWLRSRLEELGAGTAFVTVQGESRTNNNIIDRAEGTETEILEIGPTITARDKEKFMETFSELLKETDILVCSGGLPAGIPADFYRQLIDLARPRGIRVILDSNGKMLEEGIKARPWLIKPNLRELSKYAGTNLVEMKDILHTCRELVSQGITYIAASLGKDGALLVWDGHALHAKIRPIRVVNTIGSGDSMVAGLAIGLFKGFAAGELLKYGMACAVANTQFQEIGVVSKALVEKYYQEIELEQFY